ncbi:MAG: hypothetical protein Ta2B_06560 [Termitinemataceae bacterium]|nr:MAG: hypothetical protein Ta2B_06560 [Termitinemataceae bacterium]
MLSWLVGRSVTVIAITANEPPIKIPAAERRGIFVLPESCTSGLIPPCYAPEARTRNVECAEVLNPTARIKF